MNELRTRSSCKSIVSWVARTPSIITHDGRLGFGTRPDRCRNRAGPCCVPIILATLVISQAFNHSSSTNTMSQVPESTATSSTNFRTIFTAALDEYKKQTKEDITSHSLAAQLKSCESPSTILAVLRAQVTAFDKSQSADDRLTKWLDPTVNVLHAFSTILGDTVGLVIATG